MRRCPVTVYTGIGILPCYRSCPKRCSRPTGNRPDGISLKYKQLVIESGESCNLISVVGINIYKVAASKCCWNSQIRPKKPIGGGCYSGHKKIVVKPNPEFTQGK